MITREDLEKREYEILSPYAAKVAESRGRKVPEEKCATERTTREIEIGLSIPSLSGG